MFGFSQAKLIGGGIAILVIVTSLFFGYRYVVNLQEKNAQLTKDVNTLEISNESLEKQKKQLLVDIENHRKSQEKLVGELAKAREKAQKIVKLFGDHDFAKLIAKKPGLIEKKMNAATKKVIKEIEDATSK